MSKFNEIQSKIKSLSPGAYQRLCSAYMYKKYKLNNMNDIGSKECTEKTTKGIPDSYSVDEDGKYLLIMYGTVENQSIKKIKKDIKEAYEKKKTGIDNKKIKEIFCFHTNTNIKPGQYEELVNSISNIRITLISIDTLAHEIEEHFPSLASDYLSIPIDTNQISDINTFVERYDKFSANSPLDTIFINRKEKDIIKDLLQKEQFIIITGKPGTGKTKIVLETLRELEEEKNIIPLCIRINGMNLYEDLKKSIEHDEEYIIFIDDINNLSMVNAIIDSIITTNNRNIKIISTVRDYLLDEVIRKIGNCITPKIYTLNKMENDEIVDILKTNFNVKNPEWHDKILKISNGNPRLAIMSFISVRDGKIDSLNSVYDVFNYYYVDIFKNKQLNQHQIDILFFISLLSPISTSNETVKNIFEDFGIYEIQEFKYLRDIELIDYYNEDALRICDQNFANYVLYNYLIVKKSITISKLLKKLYPKFINKFINTINMINNQFYDKETFNYINLEIEKVWNEEPYKKDWNFIKYFHNINNPKALILIKEKIDLEENDELPSVIKYESNVYLSDEIILLLSEFRDSEYFNSAFELLLKYLEKKPILYNDVCKAIKDYWLIINTILDFSIELNIIEVLYSKYKLLDESKLKQIYRILLIQTLIYCLQLEFHISEQGDNNRSLKLITLTLHGNKEVYEFRNKIIDIIFILCDEEENNYNILLNSSIWFYNDDQIDILKSDLEYLDKIAFSKWTSISLLQCKLLYQFEKKCIKFNIEIPESLLKYSLNKEFLILTMMEGYNYNEENEKLKEYLQTINLDQLSLILNTLKKIEEMNINVDNWKITSSLNQIFTYILKEKNELFCDLINLYLINNCPFLSGLSFFRNIVDKELAKKVLDMVLKSDFINKYYILTDILNYYCNKEYLSLVKYFIKNQKDSKIKFSLFLSTVMEYSKFDNNLLDEYTSEILEEDNLNLYASYTHSFIDDEISDKIYEAFDNKNLLETLYLKSLTCHGDYYGKIGCKICLNNYDFLSLILKEEKNNNDGKVDNILKNIWLTDDYDEIISYNYNKIFLSKFGYFKLNKLFHCESNDIINNNQTNWFKSKILQYKNDKEKIHYLFFVICEKNDDFKFELIQYLLSVTSDIDIFKNINLFSHSESWSGSRVPVIEHKINFVDRIVQYLKLLGDSEYIYHINYLTDIVEHYRTEIKKTQIEEYVDDFLN